MDAPAPATRTAFVGCGNLGMAILFGALRSGALQASETLVVELDARRRGEAEDLGVAVSGDASDARGARTLVLAVKPQSFAEAARAIGTPADGALAISVMAGHGSDAIRAALGGRVRVVRAMPNTPAQVGMAVTALARGAGATPADLDEARHLFEGVGRTVEVEERLIDAAVATVGSGPAYLFLLAEAEVAAAIAMGIPADAARTMVTGTLLGAATLLDRDGRAPQELRAAVTSAGGTTAAAVRVLEERGFAASVAAAMEAARARSAELSK
jgi:pyrroline-5-carboxylate reductase